ncbi:formylglycine-generating enzyme family protein [Parabacteroides sp. PF5-9]|uniref:formylglycine-generating enzyme family protein n=1 Tax=Parabacteroides sp. PF5-9 TaxID=1742404 RepID=UPI0024730FE3|nr:formylglycine-generating enzyme family protein [Parabacteroides sp. PF5-9]MDH6357495.1 formylglycine-generating enzyme required for sulfatase activity [Parabacteroides sp. PF5-9]
MGKRFIVIFLLILWVNKLSAIESIEMTTDDFYVNSIGMEFVAIPAGSFLMGASEHDAEALDNEKPQHRVEISQPFSVSKHEVTQAQWEEVMGSNPFSMFPDNQTYNKPGMKERITHPSHPATVSWEDAQEFIHKLNEKEGHNRYRLPTEAEWEYMARAGTTTAYSFGDNANDLGQYAWYGEDFATGGTHPVGQKKPNSWGLYDIHGNAWEWVSDWYNDNYYKQSPSIDPQGPAEGTQKVVRSGSFHETSGSWRTSFRKSYAPNYRGISVGFRLVMIAE